MHPATPRLLVTRLLPQPVEERIRRDYEARLNPEDRLLSAEELIEAAHGCEALLVCPTEKLTAAVVEALPRSLRIVATCSVGYEHIDVAAARTRGLVVTHTPDVLTDATAELTLLLMLAAARRAHEGQRLLRSGQWRGLAPTLLLGRQLTGLRLGIVGMGRIGRAVARRARAFDMAIHYHNPRRLPPELEQGATWHSSLEGLLQVSDVLSLHCPSTPQTRRLLNAERIALLPRGALVVNTARGDIVDDEALIAALRSGHVAAAGLDVFHNEPALHPGYLALDNAFLLPHLGSATLETRCAMGFLALDNIDAVLAGRPPLTPVPG